MTPALKALALAWYFLFYDPRATVLKQSDMFDDQIECEETRQDRRKNLKDLNEWQKFWISPECEATSSEPFSSRK